MGLSVYITMHVCGGIYVSLLTNCTMCTYVNKCYFTFTVEKLVDSFERDPVDAGTGPDHSLTRLLAHAVKYYGVSPLFKVMRFEKDKFAVSFSFSLFVSVRPYCFINSAVTSG